MPELDGESSLPSETDLADVVEGLHRELARLRLAVDQLRDELQFAMGVPQPSPRSTDVVRITSLPKDPAAKWTRPRRRPSSATSAASWPSRSEPRTPRSSPSSSAATYLPRDLLTLPRFRAYARLLVDGMPSRPFSMETLPPPPATDPTRAAIIRRTSRHRYARPAGCVEEELRIVFT